MASRKAPPARVPFDKWPMSVLSHDVWTPNETVNLSPFARVRERGEIGNVAKSAIRALDIVELLARAGKPLRAIEIAGALGLSPSSAHQLLKSMMDSAWLIFDPLTKRYHPSLRFANAGGALADRFFGSAGFGGLVAAVNGTLDKTLTVNASQGSFMQILDVFEPDPAPHGVSERRQESIGLRVPIFGSCTGAAWPPPAAAPRSEIVAPATCRSREAGKIYI